MWTERSIEHEKASRARVGRLRPQAFRLPVLAILAAILPATLPSAVCFAQQTRIGNVTGSLKRGKELYRRYCVGCHGVLGNGQGENAPYLDPRPRDFTAGVFKCRSTDTGHIPTDMDLYETLGRGLHASAMPSWFPLTRQQRIDLIAYVKTFSPRFHEEKPEPVVPVPPEPPASPESLNRGLEIFKKMECAKFHGLSGRGDGPSASTLTDSKDRPIVPYDFTTGERFKCGQTNQDLYRIFMTGLDGTPMPSYLKDLKPDQAWDLVHYLRTLQMNYENSANNGAVKTSPARQPGRSIRNALRAVSGSK